MGERNTRAVDGDPGERFHRTVRFADLARDLRVDLPPFRGPLVAFVRAGEDSPGDPIFLGGDLHAIHPDSREPPGQSCRDRSLDGANVTLLDGEGWQVEVPAIEGVWGTRIGGGQTGCAPYVSIIDRDGHLRTWLILPPPRLMIGIAHFWLPYMPPQPRSR